MATDSFIISITNDKEFSGKGKANRDSKTGKFKDMKTDQPLDKSAVNDPNTLTLEQIREQKPKVKLRYSQNEFGTAEYPSGYRSIDIVYVDSKTGAETFYGRIPAYQEIITDPKTGEQSFAFKKGMSQKLINLREAIAKAEINPDTGFLEITTAETDFKGYKATVTPKTETKETTTQDIETKKADIEKRRQEELKTPIRQDKSKGEVANYKSERFEIAVNQKAFETKYDVNVSPRDGSSNTGFTYSEALSKRFDTFEEALEYANKIAKEDKKNNNKINAKYDAELAALETTSPETEVEQSARRKAIDNYFENILGQIEITALEPSLKEMDGEIERTIGTRQSS